MTHAPSTLLVPFLAVVAACGVELPIEPAPVELADVRLERVGGCADVVLFAVDADDTTLLSIALEGPLAEAAGQATRTTWELPDPEVDLKIEVGSAISDGICDDFLEDGGPIVDQTWSPISGSFTLDLGVPDGDRALATGTVEGLIVELDGVEEVIGDVDIDEVEVGWYAG